MTEIKLNQSSPHDHVYLDTESGAITVSTSAHGFEELDVDVYCGTAKRESLHSTMAGGCLASGPIARCADNAAMYLKWRLTDLNFKEGHAARYSSFSFKVSPDLLPAPSAATVAPTQVYVIDTLTEDLDTGRDEVEIISEAIPELGKTAVLADYMVFNALEEDPIRKEAVESFPEFAGVKPEAEGRWDENRDFPGKEPVWAAIRKALQEKWVDTPASEHKIVVLGDSEWGLITKPGNAEPIEVAQIAREKGVEVEIRGAGAVVYALAQMVVDGVISRVDYDAAVQVEKGECRIAWSPFLKIADAVNDGGRLAQLYLDYVGTAYPHIIVDDKSLDGAPRDVLWAANHRYWSTNDPKYADMILAALTDSSTIVRWTAVGRLSGIVAHAKEMPVEKRLQYGNALAGFLEVKGAAGFDEFHFHDVVIAMAEIAARKDLPPEEKHRFAEIVARQMEAGNETAQIAAIEGLVKAALSFEQEPDQVKYLDRVAKVMVGHRSGAVRGKAAYFLGKAVETDPSLRRFRHYADQIIARLRSEDSLERREAYFGVESFIGKLADKDLQVHYAYRLFSSHLLPEGISHGGSMYRKLSLDGRQRLYKEAVKRLQSADSNERRGAVFALRNIGLCALQGIENVEPNPIQTWLSVGWIAAHLKRGTEQDATVVKAARDTLEEMAPDVSRMALENDPERWFEKEATWEERTVIAIAFERFVPALKPDWSVGPKTESVRRLSYLRMLIGKMNLSSIPVLSRLFGQPASHAYMEAALDAYAAIRPTIPEGVWIIEEDERLKGLLARRRMVPAQARR